MSKEAMSDAGYIKVFQTGHEPKKGLSWSSKRETLAYSPDKGKVEGDEEEDDDRDEGDADERTLEVGSSGIPGSGHARLFILPQMWTVNDFLLKMMVNIFKNLRDRYQIPDHIPICLPRKFKKCYSGKTMDVGMYDVTFAARLRLPLTALHHQLANFLGLFVS